MGAVAIGIILLILSFALPKAMREVKGAGAYATLARGVALLLIVGGVIRSGRRRWARRSPRSCGNLPRSRMTCLWL